MPPNMRREVTVHGQGKGSKGVSERLHYLKPKKQTFGSILLTFSKQPGEYSNISIFIVCCNPCCSITRQAGHHHAQGRTPTSNRSRCAPRSTREARQTVRERSNNDRRRCSPKKDSARTCISSSHHISQSPSSTRGQRQLRGNTAFGRSTS